jgi:hypothetical protein
MSSELSPGKCVSETVTDVVGVAEGPAARARDLFARYA